MRLFQKKMMGLWLPIALLLSMSLASAAVNFHLEIPGDVANGDTFQVRVLVDVPAAEDIKAAEFQLTPDSGAEIISAATGSLFSSPTYVYGSAGQQIGLGLRYGETTTSDAVSGDNLLLATLTAQATAVGDTTFRFSNLAARRGALERITSSSLLTITISEPADPVCGDGVAEGAGEYCDGSDLRGQTCLSQRFPPGTLACTNSCRFDTSGCTFTPAAMVCGDGTLNSNENCDDGNTIDGDGCPADCTGYFYTCESTLPGGGDEPALGMDPTVVGTTTFRSDAGEQIFGGTDECVSESIIRDYYCALDEGWYESLADARENLVLTAESTCETGRVCSNGACVRAAQPVGGFCGTDADCTTGNCIANQCTTVLTEIRNALNSAGPNVLQAVSAIARILRDYFAALS